MNKNVVLFCVTAIAITVIGVGGWIAATGYDLDRTLGWVGTTIGPAMLTLVNLLMTKRVKDDTEQVMEDTVQVKADTESVRLRTNGVLDQLFGRVRTLEQRAGLTPPVPGAAPAVTRDPTGDPPADSG